MVQCYVVVTYITGASVYTRMIDTLVDILFTSVACVAIDTIALEAIHKIL